ncbi:activator of basal transcription 1-like [Homarus americanus]|uniref:Activator of basal transcription 1-like n=1 Tax=Homarus americanus TaxID=6706 RepID=A0A8J5K4U7_HOMAM|nr:activator of basal transcription 1-like [Homarus americanus]KAG7169905.1 Activator of basal transcription 1-like [Homarus americanus]
MEEQNVPPSHSEGSPFEKSVKKRKPGIVYLSTIPPNMNVTKIREYFGKFGELDRVFLQAAENDRLKGNKGKVKKFKKRLHFTEGWIEFKSKRKAKQMHLYLNNQPVGGKKSNSYYDMLWNIKYLPRFKWAYLKQRLEYEREVYRQRMGAEISQVRRETDHFIKASEISEKKKKKEAKAKKQKENIGNKQDDDIKSQNTGTTGSGNMFVFKQKETEDVMISKKEERKKKNDKFKTMIAEKKKKRREMKNKKREMMKKPEEDFLSSVFVGSTK